MKSDEPQITIDGERLSVQCRCALVLGWSPEESRGELQRGFVDDWVCCSEGQWRTVGDEMLRKDRQQLLDTVNGKVTINFAPSTDDTWTPPQMLASSRKAEPHETGEPAKNFGADIA